MVSLINQKYRFYDGDQEWSIKVEKILTGGKLHLDQKPFGELS